MFLFAAFTSKIIILSLISSKILPQFDLCAHTSLKLFNTLLYMYSELTVINHKLWKCFSEMYFLPLKGIDGVTSILYTDTFKFCI